MTSTRFDHLELLAHAPPGKPRGAPLLFVHGAYAGAWCWEEHFLPWFAKAGHPAYALSLSGHGGSAGREHLDSFSIADYVADVAQAVQRLPEPPVLVGHSMGGYVIQKYLAHHPSARGMVLLASVPQQGLMSSALHMMVKKPQLLFDLNRMMGGGNMSIRSLRETLFAQEVSEENLRRYRRLSQPESFRALWDMTLFHLTPPVLHAARVPTLVMGGGEDRVIPPTLVETTARSFGVPAHILPGLGHALMLEKDWQIPAQKILDWMKTP